MSTALPSGETLRGFWSVGFSADNGGDRGESPISFGFRLPASPEPVYLPNGMPGTSSCPGTFQAPEAQPGFLCVYEGGFKQNLLSTPCVYNGATVCGTATRFGALVFVEAAGPGRLFVNGTWAVTAP